MLRWRRGWLVAGTAALGAAIAFVLWAGVRPAYDAYGWLTWGRQALHWNLDTSAAPSWKPLTFLFTYPFALLGTAAPWLWMVTATAAAFAVPIFAARIVYRLLGGADAQRYAAFGGAAFAAAGVLGLRGYWHFVIIFTADPMMVALILGAIDCHLARHRRGAFALLILAALGRPEVWPFAVLYAAWLWRGRPSRRIETVIGVVVVVVLWFGIAALTSPSWFSAGSTALTASTPLHGNKLVGVINNFLGLYEWPMHLAALIAVALAIARRNRTQLMLAGAAVLWVAIWVGLAVRGWEPDPRYMLEPAAVEVLLAGVAVGSVLSLGYRRGLIRWASLVAVGALVVALIHPAQIRLRLAHNNIRAARLWALQIARLHTVITQDGGPARILSCAPVVTTLPYQSILAWEMGENVADIGWAPGHAIRARQSMVLFWPHLTGWEVQPFNLTGPKRGSCARLRRNSHFTYKHRASAAARATVPANSLRLSAHRPPGPGHAPV